MLLFSESDVRALLPMREAIRLMRSAFLALASGQAQNQPRRRLFLPSGSVLHSMAGAWGAYFGTKIYSTNPRHGAHFLFVLYRAADAEPLALFEASALGQIRTGAASGLATGVLAARKLEAAALIGAGFQARSQLEALLEVRQPAVVRVWSRDPARRAAFAAECSQRLGARVEAAASAEQAVRGAGIITTATSAREPVLDDTWVAAGAHVNAIGSNHPRRRELPAELVRRAGLIVVDSREQARIESGDLLLALGDEDWQSPAIVELQDLVSGARTFEPDGSTVTLFKSNGLGVEDVAAAAYVYEAAEKSGRGQRLPVYS